MKQTDDVVPDVLGRPAGVQGHCSREDKQIELLETVYAVDRMDQDVGDDDATEREGYKQ